MPSQPAVIYPGALLKLYTGRWNPPEWMKIWVSRRLFDEKDFYSSAGDQKDAGHCRERSERCFVNAGHSLVTNTSCQRKKQVKRKNHNFGCKVFFTLAKANLVLDFGVAGIRWMGNTLHLATG